MAAVWNMASGQAVATLPEPELLMGNVAKFTVSVPMPNDSAKVELPLLREAASSGTKYVGLANDSVELLVKHKKALEVQSDRYSMRYDLYVQSFDSGTYILPSLEFLVGSDKVTSNPVNLKVIPVKAKADDKIDDFSDIAQPFEVNENLADKEQAGASVLVWWIIATAILLALLIVGYFFLGKKGKGILRGRPKLPYRVALEKLEKLRKRNLPKKGRTKEYYTGLTDAIREYLKTQFGIKTYEKTSSEILAQIEADNRLSTYADTLKSIFELSDFVKFARVSPAESENDRCMAEAVSFIQRSHPVEEETAKEGKARKGGAK